MDKKRSLLNVFSAIFFKIAILVLSLFTRRFLIMFVGNEANGINSLFTSIIGFLSIAELGVGSAISFSLYKPIAEGDKQKTAAIYHLIQKLYLIIGAVIFVAGLCVMPALPILAKGYSYNNLYLTFFIMLVSVVIGYAYNAKSSLINAYKNNYITTTIVGITDILRHILQIGALIVFKSFVAYLLCRIIATLLHWLLVELCFKKGYREIAKINAQIDKETKADIVKNTKAMFMHKIGNVLVNTADSVIISAFLGVVLLGKYSNYTAIMTAMTGIISLFFTPLTSVVGHLCAQESVEKQKKYFKFIYYFNFAIGLIFFLGYYAVIDGVVAIMFGADLLLGKSVSFIITLNYFIQFMRQTVLLFRDATGTFYNDRFKPVIEGVINVILSIILVKLCGIVGVLIATIITNILICHVVEPFVLYKHAFKQTPTKYYVLNYVFIGIFTGLLVLLNFVSISYSNYWLYILVNGFIAVGLAVVPIVLLIVFSKSLRENLKNIFVNIKNKLTKKH